jgi:hypothetical protein
MTLAGRSDILLKKTDSDSIHSPSSFWEALTLSKITSSKTIKILKKISGRSLCQMQIWHFGIIPMVLSMNPGPVGVQKYLGMKERTGLMGLGSVRG